MSAPKPLWISYAHADNASEDFAYLVQELGKAGVPALYDRITIVPGRRLWDQIAARITKGDLAGWAYLVTPKSIESKACQEELAYALDRALREPSFPLIGLVHGVPFSEIPAALRVRLAVDLRAPDWTEQVKAGVENRPPIPRSMPVQDWRLAVHQSYRGRAGVTAFEIGPRFGEVRHWRLAYPKAGPAPVSWGHGAAGGGGTSSVHLDVLQGEVDFAGERFVFTGSGDALSPATSAYLAFSGPMPRKLAFGVAKAPHEVPAEWFPLGVS